MQDTLAPPGITLPSYGYDRAQRLTTLSKAIGGVTNTNHSHTLNTEDNRTALSEYVSGITGSSRSVVRGQVDDPARDGDRNSLDSSLRVEPRLRLGEVEAHGTNRDPLAFGDLLVSQSARGESQYAHLRGCQQSRTSRGIGHG